MLLILLTAAICGLCILLELPRPLALAALVILTFLACGVLRNSRTDPLTGLYNLRHLHSRKRAYRRRVLAVWYFDLDHLKQVNDTQGHRAGDRLLLDFARTLRDCPHPGAEAYRIGGDEFLLILPNPPQQSAPPLTSTGSLPASWGCASGSGAELDVLIELAEQRMYQSRSL
jgi:hypothetical protein